MDIQVANLTFDRVGSLWFSVVLENETCSCCYVTMRGFRVMNGHLRAPASLRSDESGWYRFCGFTSKLAKGVYESLSEVIFAAADDDPIKAVKLLPLDEAVKELLLPEKKGAV